MNCTSLIQGSLLIWDLLSRIKRQDKAYDWRHCCIPTSTILPQSYLNFWWRTRSWPLELSDPIEGMRIWGKWIWKWVNLRLEEKRTWWPWNGETKVKWICLPLSLILMKSTNRKLSLTTPKNVFCRSKRSTPFIFALKVKDCKMDEVDVRTLTYAQHRSIFDHMEQNLYSK